MHIINRVSISVLSVSIWMLLNQHAFAQEIHPDTHHHAPQVQPQVQMQQKELDHQDHHSHMHHQMTNSSENLSKKTLEMKDSLVRHTEGNREKLASQQVATTQMHEQHSTGHLKEHGGQIYQRTVLEQQWSKQADGQGQWSSELQTWVGTDENKILIRAHTNKAESESYHYDVAGLYSRNIATFWDAQVGFQYLNDRARIKDTDQVKLMFGVQGLVPYYFETEAYMYVGQDDQLSLSFETERDILLTQKWIVQPYLNLNFVLQDHSKYAEKTGVNQAQFGVETRYEITKKIMPYLDVAYSYDAGQKQTSWQQHISSDWQWVYGAGLRLKF